MCHILQPRLRKLLAVHRETRAFIRKRVAEHKATFDEGNMRDFIDLYLKTEKSGETSGAMTGMNQYHVSNVSLLLCVIHM